MMSATVPFRSAHPDAVRIAALSAAISLNLAMLLMALRPIATDLLVSAPDAPMTVSFPKPQPVQPVPPIALPALPHAAVVPRARPTVAPPTVEPSTYIVPATQPVSPVATPAQPALQPVAPVADTPVQATLAYIEAPPPVYPMQARRLRLQGRVLLRVLVDAQGRPQQVLVQDSSGHRLLDRTAREQVLRYWRFRPAEVDGRRVRAWALIPVDFNLR
ncbi:MAG TPA: TonB family protein [Rhodanobacteraceae bacterium]|jgi:protein TonB|nr:TonB family protein [Rhodanobacteraceae bacterium]